jgi:hypothetical protein
LGDRANTQSAELFQGEHELFHAPRKAVEAEHHHHIESALRASCISAVSPGRDSLAPRQSLKTRDMARARKRAANLEDPQEFQQRTLAEAITAFDAHCVSDGLKHSTLRKYRNSLARFRNYVMAARWLM